MSYRPKIKNNDSGSVTDLALDAETVQGVDVVSELQKKGTVTSVSAGTGLSISGTATTTPTVNIASGYKLLTTAEYNTLDAKVSNVQSDWNATSGLSAILNKPTLATVATSGSYDDLANKPSMFNFTGVISTQTITIKSIETSGIYLLTYNGPKKIKTAIGEVANKELILVTSTTYNNILVVSKISVVMSGSTLYYIRWKLVCPYDYSTLYKGITYQALDSNNQIYWTGEVYNENIVQEDIRWDGGSSSSDDKYYYPIYRDIVYEYDTSSGQTKNKYINLKNGPKYAGGTAVTLNGTSKSATDASFYAPTSSGTSGQFLKSAGSNASPTWETVAIPTESTVSGWGFTKNTGTVVSVDSVESAANGNVSLSAVRYSSQSLTDAQKSQARTNIGAGTITGISVNGISIATSGVAALTDIATQEWVTNKIDTGYYMKAQQADDGTIDDLFSHVRYGSGYSGSVYINKKASGTGSEIPTGWYNYIFSPHRHGMVTSDNLAKPFYTNYTTTVSGVTCVFDENGFLTMNGTSTGTGSLWLCLQTTIDESRTYHFCIYNALNQDNSTFVRLDNNSTTAVALVRGSSTGVDVNLSAGTFSALLWIGSSGQTFNNLVIKPMLIKGDNPSYGTILLFPMTDDNRNAYRVRCASNEVTSVRVISTVTSVSASNIASGYKLPTTTEWDSKANSSALGDQVTYSYSGGTLTITTK